MKVSCPNCNGKGHVYSAFDGGSSSATCNVCKGSGVVEADGGVCHHQFGEYVISGIQNAFNRKMSFWISKKDYTFAVYCFSAYSYDQKEIQYMLNDHEEYIRLFESQLERMRGEKA